MKKERIARIHDLLGLVNTLYPPALAEEWDNAGLQVGDTGAELNRVLLCLDPSELALDAAREAGAQAILTHHPLIFHPLKNLTPGDETGRILFRAVREGVAVLCAHTNLDRAAPGLNDWLAERLGLSEISPLAADRGGDLLKLVVFVPRGYEEAVADALFKGGAGKVGNYDRCSFAATGIGTFRPGTGTEPFLGRQGETERVGEIRLETILPREAKGKVVEKMLRAHPYEEVAYDLIPLANRRPHVGLGRIGRLAQPATLGDFAGEVKVALGAGSLRLVGDLARTVDKVAVCGGSGASLLGEAARQGADVLVTGDLKYHDARSAEGRGMALIDAGHFATERLMIQGMAAALREETERRGLNIEFIEMEGEEDPFKTI
jgi:dinuclear metal center YbgI/SA1388 family protein